ncbi:hypothetical protein [Rubinisphaera sp.]|uniref:hypothetical protein n=1 Tax=Rubinisphaera sp. TaxID=2024857 RepID=UPI000C100626|nr:hypothetical protein [Rubinisphaera sp.]MBV08201.1 hypothetical protein [Rubinisphaera sp.]HCS54670.1 hypothetical protein [Planctomycetaceae bacterium]
MAKKFKRPENRKLTPQAQRVLYLLDKLWHGNKAAMARDLNLSTSVVNQVEYGIHSPGTKFLEALSKYPGINAEWIRTGEGVAEIEHGNQSTSLPLTDQPLPGRPEDYLERFTGRYELMISQWGGSSRYLWKVRAYDAKVLKRDYEINTGDLILVETDPKLLANPSYVSGRLVIYTSKESSAGHVKIGRAHAHTLVSNQVTIEIEAPAEKSQDDQFSSPVAQKHDRSLRFEMMNPQSPADSESETRNDPTLSDRSNSDISTIHGVCLLLVRSEF